MSLSRTLLFAAALSSLASCGSSSSDPGSDAGASGSDGGSQAADGGAKSDASVGQSPIRIDSSTFGIDLIDHPYESYPSVDGMFEIKENGKTPVSTIAVKINGTEVASGTGDAVGLVNLAWSSAARTLVASAGDTLTLSAASATSSSSLALPCPAEVTITSPEEGASVSYGQTLSVTWTGSPGSAVDVITAPVVRLVAYNTASNKEEIGAMSLPAPATSRKELSSGDRSAQLVVPTLRTAFDFVLELRALGPLVSTADGTGFCSLKRRIHLKRQ